MTAVEIMAKALDDTYDVNRGGEVINLEQCAQAALTALADAGLCVVPVELIERCRDREYNPFERDNQTKLHGDLCAMIAEAPKP